MTTNEMIDALGGYNIIIFIVFVLIPTLVFGYGKAIAKDRGIEKPHKYAYSFFIYLTSIPGMFSSVLTAYVLFILRSSLLDVNFVVYFVPIISMVVTIFIIKKKVNLDYIPGFDRLYGLFIILGVTFTLSLMILQTRIWIFFHSPILSLFIIIIVLFAFLKVGSDKLFRGKPGKRIEPE